MANRIDGPEVERLGIESGRHRVESAVNHRRRSLHRLTSPAGLAAIVAVIFVAAQLVLFDEHRFLEWDEAVYLGRASDRFDVEGWAAHRALGIPWLLGPLFQFTASFSAMRLFLIATSSVAVAIGFSSWIRVAGRRAPLGMALFCSSWLALFYGSEASPNLYVAAACVGTVGQLVQVGPQSGTRTLGLLAVGIALATLLRPTDGLVLAVGTCGVGMFLASDGHRRTVPAAAAAGFAVGIVPWITDAVINFGGPFERWQQASALVDSSIRSQLSNHAKLLDGPLTGPDPQSGYPIATLLVVALMIGLAAYGAVVAELRRASIISSALAALMAAPYLFYVGTSAPRFLLPAFALLAVPSAIGIDAIRERSRAGVLVVMLAVMAAGTWSAVRADTVEAEQVERRHEAELVGRGVRLLAADQDCRVLSQYGSPQIGVASGCSAERLLVDVAGCQVRQLRGGSEVVIVSFVGPIPHGLGPALTDEEFTGPLTWRSVVVDPGRARC